MAWDSVKEDVLGLSHPVDAVWAVIPDVLKNLDWKIERTDEITHRVRAKTRVSIMAWPTTLFIAVEPLDDNRSKVSVRGETGGQVIDYGRTLKRIDLFFEELQKQIGNTNNG